MSLVRGIGGFCDRSGDFERAQISVDTLGASYTIEHGSRWDIDADTALRNAVGREHDRTGFAGFFDAGYTFFG